MSLFISNENQKLLYEMIHKTPEIQKAFSSLDAKNKWFREIIENFFKQLPPNIDREVLKKVNRDTLGYMVNSLKSILNVQPPIHTDQKPITLLKKEQPVEPKEYTSFFDIPKPKIIDFSEQLNDEVITNMDELIEQQKKMRERELQEYAPQPPIPMKEESSSHPQKINILEDLPTSVIQEKHVHFSLPSPIDERMTIIENKIDKLMEMFSSFRSEKQENTSVNMIKQLIQENV